MSRMLNMKTCKSCNKNDPDKIINHSDLKKILAHHNNMICFSKLESGPKYHQTKKSKYTSVEESPTKTPKQPKDCFLLPRDVSLRFLGMAARFFFKASRAPQTCQGRVERAFGGGFTVSQPIGWHQGWHLSNKKTHDLFWLGCFQK